MIVVSGQIGATLLGYRTPQLGAYIGISNIFLLSIFIYATMPASGGHLNPFITLSAMLVGICPVSRATLYILAQTIGAAAAGGLLYGIWGPTRSLQLQGGGCFYDTTKVTSGQVFLNEICGSFALLFLAFGVGLDPRQAEHFGPHVAPLLVGVALGLVSFASSGMIAGYTGAQMNPARCFAFGIARRDLSDQWIWWFGPLIAVLFLAVLYHFVPPHHAAKEHKRDETKRLAGSGAIDSSYSTYWDKQPSHDGRMDHFTTDTLLDQPVHFEAPWLCADSGGQIGTLRELYEYPGTQPGFDNEGTLSLGHVPPESAAAFLQRWMYFGLLRVILLLQDMDLDTNAFVRQTTALRKVITSAQLPMLLDQWTRREKSRVESGDKNQPIRFDEMKKALSYARHVVWGVASDRHSEVVESVVLSIQALAFTITATMKERFPQLFLGFNPAFGPARRFLEQLSAAGWCPRDVTVLEHDLYIDSQYYCTSMRPLRSNISHAACSKFKCNAVNIDEATYQTQHVSATCSCAFVMVPLERLHELVDGYKIPLVRYRAPSMSRPLGSLDVVEQEGSEENVAFSHVWADGLGNTNQQNALPGCQLDRLQKLANLTYEKDSTSACVPFYIDTLCVPRDREWRAKAIGKMRDVYGTAGRVLVLDRDIEQISSQASRTAICMGIFFSGWMRRLWTYQEGALNPFLYFKLSDSVLSLQGLKTWGHQHLWAADELWNGLPNQSSVTKLSLAFIIKTLEVLDLDAVPRSLTLALLSDAFHWRSTTRLEDEAVVIAAFMGHNPRDVLELDGSGRMQALLRAIGKVPAALTMLSGDRIEAPGYRWAPKSLLQAQDSDDRDPLSRWYSTMLRINTPSSFTNEVHVGEVLESGTLRLREPGYIMFPQAKDPDTLIASPFWAFILVQRVQLENMQLEENTVVASGLLRVRFLPDASGPPAPLPQKPFFVVSVEEPRPTLDGALPKVAAFIGTPDDDCSKQLQQGSLGETLSPGPVSCTFYCRAEVQMVEDISIVQRRSDWQQELFAQDGSIKTHLVRHMADQEWLVS
ncbi:hypothetical protein OQA88_1823 [Cercophora sp. LCS_1]